MYHLYNTDVVEWAKEYDGPKFHALICDPPYFLDTVQKRYGNMNKDSEGIVADRIRNRSDGLARLASGFLGVEWDTDIAFYSDTWKVFGELMHDGAIGMAFSHSRNYHRMASAIEEAGFIIYPLIAWINSQGFPHPTKVKEDGWDDFYYNRNVLKGSIEPICVFQKAYPGKMWDAIEKTGAGVWNIGAGRVAGEPVPINVLEEWSGFGEKIRPKYIQKINTKGRWPANLIGTDGFDLPFDDFFYQMKPTVKEKNAGLNEKNPHPTIKPIDLIRYLSSLILPPGAYAPRRLFVPFSGTGSEMIGCLLAGWDHVTGVEIENKSLQVAKRRLEHYVGE